DFSRSNTQTQCESSFQSNTKKSSEESWNNVIDEPTNWLTKLKSSIQRLPILGTKSCVK
ncbi:hypothetical protein MKW92_042871, partial [Papaver armeniacum]